MRRQHALIALDARLVRLSCWAIVLSQQATTAPHQANPAVFPPGHVPVDECLRPKSFLDQATTRESVLASLCMRSKMPFFEQVSNVVAPPYTSLMIPAMDAAGSLLDRESLE